MTIKLTGIDHIVLRTTKLEAMLHFYCEILGCTIERDTSTDNGLIQLRAGNALIDLVIVDSELGRLGGGPPTAAENNVDHYCLQVEPIPELEIIAQLERQGVTTGTFEKRYGAQGYGNSIYISDPQGNTVELRERTP
jgi:glyoxylase I family protein